jgi:hypothetical protein
VSEEKKERKPLLEALASVTDGLDVLVGLEKEKKEEKPTEQKAPDTFGGILQSMIPLLIVPQILPLFQQALGQTLQSTTVNVKVESSTALIPISIEASTVIMPIEIRASQVTLNVAIKQSDVTLKISIENSTVTLDVNITNNILNINIVNSQTTLNINIVSSVTTLNVNITNTVLYVNANVTNTVLNVNANVTNTVLNVNATIVNSTATLNVNIANSTTTLNVNIATDVNIIIKSQTVGIYLGDTWLTLAGYDIDLSMFTALDPFERTQIGVWYPNSGEVYLIEAISVSYIVPKDTVVRPELIVFEVRVGSTVVTTLSITREKPTDFVNIMRTISVTASEPLTVHAVNYSPMAIWLRGTVFMYRVR